MGGKHKRDNSLAEFTEDTSLSHDTRIHKGTTTKITTLECFLFRVLLLGLSEQNFSEYLTQSRLSKKAKRDTGSSHYCF